MSLLRTRTWRTLNLKVVRKKLRTKAARAPLTDQESPAPTAQVSIMPTGWQATAFSPLTKPGDTHLGINAGADKWSLTDSIKSQMSNSALGNPIHKIEEIIKRATNETGDGGDSDAKGTGFKS